MKNAKNSTYIAIVGRGLQILILLSIEDIDSNEMALCMSVLSSLGSRHISHLPHKNQSRLRTPNTPGNIDPTYVLRNAVKTVRTDRTLNGLSGKVLRLQHKIFVDECGQEFPTPSTYIHKESPCKGDS